MSAGSAVRTGERANDQGKLAPYVGLGPTPENPLPYEFLIPNVDSAAEFASFDGSGRLSFMLQTSSKRYLAATLQKGGVATRPTTLPVASNELDGRRYLFVDLNGDGVQEAVDIPNTFDNHGSVVTTLGLPGVYSNNGLNFAPPVGSPNAPNAYTVHVRQAGAGEEFVTYNALDDETNHDRRVGDGRLSHVATTYTDRAHEVSCEPPRKLKLPDA